MFRVSEIFLYKLPVNDIPDSVEIFRPRIAIVDVVGMLPDIDGQQRHIPVTDYRRIRVVGIDSSPLGPVPPFGLRQCQ